MTASRLRLVFLLAIVVAVGCTCVFG